MDGVAGVEPGMDDGSHVYNLEVEDCHTYFAHGTLVHNCHHSVAPSYIRVLKYFRSAKVIGLTATPDRQDEKGLGKVYDSVPYKHDIADGIRGGWLVGIRAQRFVVSEIDLRFVDTHGKDGDFVARALDEETLKGVASIVDHILKHAPNGKGIVFWPGVATARAASLYMNEKVGGSSEFISGDKGEFPTEVRKSIVERFRKGHFMWLHNCQIATEGFDVPDVDTVVLARMTKSRALYAQMVGRGLRPLIEALLGFDRKDQAEDRRVNIQWSAKPELHLMDFVGVVGEHRLVTPADLLGEGADEKVVERARKIMEQAEHAEHTEGMDPLAALAQAKVEIDELQKLVRSARVTSKATVYDIDPFEFSTVEVNNDADELDMRFGAKPATENQLIPLRKAGISEGVLQTLTRRRASALFDLLDRRREAGLAKFTQLNVLRRHIAVDDSITYDRAHEALDYLAASKWRPNPKTLEAILYGGREPGMDG